MSSSGLRQRNRPQTSLEPPRTFAEYKRAIASRPKKTFWEQNKSTIIPASLISLIVLYIAISTARPDLIPWLHSRSDLHHQAHGRKRPVARSVNSQTPTSSSAGTLELTDAELSKYNGEDANLPIYIAINGSIFDVSASPNFYGPGTHYGHFSGRDATRAWVTTCFSPPSQLTWDMRDVEEMFMPSYLDEQLERAAEGTVMDNGDPIPHEMKAQAQAVLKKVGRVSREEVDRRKKEDVVEAREEVEAAVKHWLDFYRDDGKYVEVGRVVGRRSSEEEFAGTTPPALCESAKKKRPVKSGKLEKTMSDTMAKFLQ
ncbi:hypothetical protein LTR50_001760 [Elasticomyces elasticus]|nr:hypothetical protein LTR50_001760 [Elasticomyces elasticus]